jgi:hypothetical protein
VAGQRRSGECAPGGGPLQCAGRACYKAVRTTSEAIGLESSRCGATAGSSDGRLSRQFGLTLVTVATAGELG